MTTKKELEVRIAELESELEQTKSELEQTKKELLYKNEYIETLEYLHETDTARLRAIYGSRDIVMQEHLKMHGELVPLRSEIANYKSGPRANQAKSRDQKGYFLERYDRWLTTEPNKQKARYAANRETGREFGVRHKQTGWYYTDDYARKDIIGKRKQ